MLKACDFNSSKNSSGKIVFSHYVLSYKRNVYEFVVSTLEKNFDRIPVESTIICNAIVFNPAKMIATQTDELHKKSFSKVHKLKTF